MIEVDSTRRGFLGLAAGAAALAAAGAARPAPVPTRARIVILGAGAAGTSLANRLTDRLSGAQITLIDPRVEHWYQPGFTLIAAGLKPAGYSVSQTADWLPGDVTLLAEAAAEIDPDARRVTTDAGTRVDYDFLVVATGLKLDWGAVDGFDPALIGANGLGAVYAGPEAAAKTWAAMDRFTDDGGVGLFTRPATEMKCAGAPLKYAFLTDDYARRKDTRGKSELIYLAHNDTFFSVPIVNEKVRMLFDRQQFDTRFNHVLRAVDPAGLRAILAQARSGPVHMHLSEQMAEVDEVLGHLGARPTEWLLANHAVDAGWCLIHCTPMTEAETIALARTGAVAGLCPITESSLGDGIFNAMTFLGAGGAIGFGSDSNIHIALFDELKTLEYSQRLRDHARAALATPDRSTGRVLFDAAARGGAQAGGRASGRIAVGALADLVGLDDDNEWLCNRQGDAALDSLIFGGGGKACIRDVWSAGRHVVAEGRHFRREPIIERYIRTMTRLETDI